MKAERGSTMMVKFSEDIERCVASELHHAALMTALTVPDICGALDGDGTSKHEKSYAPWFDTYVAPMYSLADRSQFGGSDCYQMRCRMLHQGTTAGHKGRYSKIEVMFSAPEAAGIPFITADVGQTLVVNGLVLCHRVAYAVHEWLEVVEGTLLFEENSANALRILSLSFPA